MIMIRFQKPTNWGAIQQGGNCPNSMNGSIVYKQFEPTATTPVYIPTIT